MLYQISKKSNFSSSLGTTSYLKTCDFFYRYTRVLLPLPLDAMRLSALRRMATDWKLSSVFMRLTVFAQKNNGFNASVILLSPVKLRSQISGFQKLSAALSFDLHTKSLKTWGTLVSGPDPEPFERDIFA